MLRHSSCSSTSTDFGINVGKPSFTPPSCKTEKIRENSTFRRVTNEKFLSIPFWHTYETVCVRAAVVVAAACHIFRGVVMMLLMEERKAWIWARNVILSHAFYTSSIFSSFFLSQFFLSSRWDDKNSNLFSIARFLRNLCSLCCPWIRE